MTKNFYFSGVSVGQWNLYKAKSSDKRQKIHSNFSQIAGLGSAYDNFIL